MNRKKHNFIYVILILGIVLYFAYSFYSKAKEHVLTNGSNNEKIEEVRAVFSSVDVVAENDTEIVFRDIRSEKIYKSIKLKANKKENIKLKKRHWYKIKAKGTIKIYWAEVKK